jgi:hypothetical protein
VPNVKPKVQTPPIIQTPPVSSTLMSRGIYDADANNVVDTVQALHWNDIIAKPLVFPPIMPHPIPHTINEIVGLSASLASFITTEALPAEVSAITYTKPQLDAQLNTKANVIHFHDDRYYLKAYVDEVTSPSGIDASLAVLEENSPLLHGHDDRYYTKAYIDDAFNTTDISLVNDARYYTKPEVDSAISTRAPLIHNHNDLYYTKDQINGFFATMGDGLYVYTPGTAMTHWDIHHGLGRYPTVNVVVSGELALAKVIYPDTNSLTIYFSSPQIGNAYLT